MDNLINISLAVHEDKQLNESASSVSKPYYKLLNSCKSKLIAINDDGKAQVNIQDL